MLQCIFGFEQRRNVQPVGNAKQAREIQCRQYGEGVIAFRDQEADRRIAVNMLENLGNGDELADRRRLFNGEGCKVHTLRRKPGDHFIQLVEKDTALNIGGTFNAQRFSDGVVELHCIKAEMNPR